MDDIAFLLKDSKIHLADTEAKHIYQSGRKIGEYDLGAALINAGWCLADPKEGNIYIPYEENARSKKVGLWQGKFYMPWDWQKIKARKANIKIIKPKKAKKKSAWSNLF